MRNEDDHDVDNATLSFRVSEHKAELPSYFSSTKIPKICFCWSISKGMVDMFFGNRRRTRYSTASSVDPICESCSAVESAVDVDGTVRLNIDKDDDVENQYSKSVVPKQKIKYPTYSHCAKFPRAGFHQSMTDNLLCLFFQGKHRAVGDTRSTMTSIDQTCTAVESAVDADSHEVLSNDKSDGVKRRRMQVDILGTKVDSPTSSICDKIVVTGLSKNTDNDLIRLFFGNKRRTGGGPVSSVNRIGKTCAAVEFESAEDAKSVLQKGNLILDQHVLEIHRLDFLAVKLQRILPHTFGKLGDSGDAVSCDPRPEQRSDCSSVSLHITEQDVPIHVPLPESKLLPIVDKPSNLHNTDTNSQNCLSGRIEGRKFVQLDRHYFHYLDCFCREDIHSLFNKCKEYNVALSFNKDGFHLSGPNGRLGMLISNIRRLLKKIKCFSFLVLNAYHLMYLLGLKGREYLKALGRNNHCLIAVDDTSSKNTRVLQYSKGFLTLANIKLDNMCEVVIAMGDIDVCDTDAIVHIHIVKPSKAARIRAGILKTGDSDHSVGQLDVLKDFKIFVIQPGKLSSKSMFHVVLSYGKHVKQDLKALFEELIEHVLKEANNMNMKSIAIPGPNGAVFSMPMMKTCDIILTVTNAFLMKQNDQSCLKKIVVIHSSQHVVRSLLFLSQSIFCSRTLLTESASSILGDDMAVNNPSQHVKSTEHGQAHIKDRQQHKKVFIYSMSAESINSVQEDILHHLAQMFHTEVVPCFDVANFTEQQKQDVFSLEEQFGVNINMDIIRGVVIFTGEEVNVFRAVSNVKDMIMSYISKQRYTPISLTHVRWQLKVSKYNFSDYHPDNARIIERAFIDKRPEVYIQTQNKDVFKIVFDEWKEYCLTDKHKQPSTIRRLDLSQENQSIELPNNWDPMEGEIVKRVIVVPGCDEYQRVVKRLNAIASVPKIERIQNRTLFQQYKVKQFEVEKFSAKKTDNEKILFHGTSSDCVEPIIQNGFNRSLCGKNGTTYGDGVYFAVDPQYSMTYGQNQQVFQVRVLVGETTTGHHGLKTTPLKPGTKRHYDSVTDSELSPKMFVIFHDAQAYPDYLITL